MEYFTSFPKTTYNNEDIVNICTRLDFLTKIKDNAVLFEELQLNEGETPEEIAQLAYKDPNLFWIILWANDVVDPFLEWCMSDSQLLTYVQEKYGIGEEYSVHHYETTSSSDLGEGIWVDYGTSFSTSVSNYSYEQEINETRRKIKLIRPELITQVIEEYREALK